MTFLDCCEVVRTNGLHMIRPSKDTPGHYDLCEPFEGSKDWVWLDKVTANVVCQVYRALSPEKQDKFKRLPAGTILDICWKAASQL